MTPRVVLLLLIAPVWAMAVAPPGPEKPAAAALEEVLSVGGIDGDALLMWVDLAVDDDGRIYVTDGLDYAVKVFDSQGRRLGKAGRKGQGPGEFQAPRELALSSTAVYVSDQFRPMLFVFSRQLEFRAAFPIPRPISCLRALSDGTLAFASLPLAEKDRARIWFLDIQGQVQHEIVYGRDDKRPLQDKAVFDFSEASVVVAFNFRDRIEKYDRAGRRLWCRSLLGVKDIRPERILGFSIPTKFIYKDIVLDDQGRVYVLGGSVALHPSQDVFILSPEGRLLATCMLPEATHCLYVDRQGYLYARANEGVTIKKYRIRIPGKG